VNHTPGPVQIFWLDYKGKRRLYRTIPARLSHLIRTYVGHPWVVADASGRALEVFIPREASSVAVVESPLQAKAPSTEPTLNSIDSKAKASIRFVNRTTGTLQLYWLDYHGKRQLRDHVAPAQDRLLTTFATHPWVVTDAAGKALALYRPTDSGNWVAIIEPSSGH